MEISDLCDHDREVATAVMKAIDAGLRMEVRYDGLDRIVEPHAVGVNHKGNPVMRVYQVVGDSNSETSGWKLMSLGKVYTLPQLLDIHTSAPREGYKLDDSAMVTIFKQVTD